MVLCHQITGLSPTRLDYPLCLRVNAKFLRCQCNGSKHLMLHVLLPGRNLSWYLYYTQNLENYQPFLIILIGSDLIPAIRLAKHFYPANQVSSNFSLPHYALIESVYGFFYFFIDPEYSSEPAVHKHLRCNLLYSHERLFVHLCLY